MTAATEVTSTAEPLAAESTRLAVNSDPTDSGPIKPAEEGLFALLAPIRGKLVTAVTCQVIASLAGIVPFLAVAELGRVLLSGSNADPDRAWTIAWIAVAALLVRLVFLIAAGSITHFADNDLQLDIRRRLAARLGRVPLGWFTDRNSGDVRKALQEDVHAMHHLVAHSLLNFVAGILVPIVSLIYLFWVDWRMTLVTLVPVVIGLALWVRTMSGYGESMKDYGEAQQRITNSVIEFVQGIAVVKTFGQTGRAHRRFAQAADDFARFWLAWVKPMEKVYSVSTVALTPVTMLLTVLAGGAVFIVQGWMPAVDLLPFALLGLGLTTPLLTMEFSSNDMQLAKMAAKRVVTLLATPELPQAGVGARPHGNEVVFSNVSFSYDGSTEVLRDLDLTLRPGTVTALVGPSGSGKSTVAKLLPRFWDISGGLITIGGVDIRQLPTDELYRRVSFVFQEVRLLRTTVLDNIRLARPDADLDAVWAAAKAAQIHGRIMELPRGYDSVVGEDAQLSGGEAQRLSIARAVLADTPVLVLDEATAFADPESEATIQEALSKLTTGRTVLVIAHRLSTVVNANQIVVLDAGRIAERGTHPDLVAAGGIYAGMWASHQRASQWQPRSTDKESQQ